MHSRKKCLFDPVHNLFLSALETVSCTDDDHKPLGVMRIQKTPQNKNGTLHLFFAATSSSIDHSVSLPVHRHFPALPQPQFGPRRLTF